MKIRQVVAQDKEEVDHYFLFVLEYLLPNDCYLMMVMDWNSPPFQMGVVEFQRLVYDWVNGLQHCLMLMVVYIFV